jgi:hypothetical protein
MKNDSIFEITRSQSLRQKFDDSKCAQMVEISTIRNQAARASNQIAVTHAQKVHELESQNELCMQRFVKKKCSTPIVPN